MPASLLLVENEQIVVVCNFTPVPRIGYRVGLPTEGSYREIMNSDWGQYGGSGIYAGRDV